MQSQDQIGLDFTASSDKSVVKYNAVLDRYLASKQDTMPCLEELIDFDNDMTMALCLRGYMLKMAGDPRFSSAVFSCIDTVTACSLNDREQMHLGALTSWANNQYREAARTLETVLAIYPKDMLALRLVHYLHFYAGDSIELRESVTRSVKVWQQDDPYYGYLLGMHSFGLEEAGDYEEAEAAGRQAIELNKEDIWAAHAVAHVFQMQGRISDGIPWVGSLLDQWDDANNFVYHLHWHKALFHIGAGELEEALAIYDAHLVGAITDDFYLDACNATALLWRLKMHGLDVGDRWEGLREVSQNRGLDDELVFSTLHYLMTPAVLKDETTISNAMKHFESWSKEKTSQGEVCRKVGLPLAHSIVDLGQGNYKSATERLSSIKDDIYLIGGSHAQRHLFDDLLNHYQTLN
jgi:tetratricopeptide (TPR) repeat protein